MSNQLIKKDYSEGYRKVFPKTFIDAIKDRETGMTLAEILQGFNMYFLSYNGNKAETRNQVPPLLRKEGLWITYVLYDHTVVSEWYDNSKTDDDSWGSDENWRIASNALVGDISVSSDGYWVINGIKTASKAQGEKGTTPLLRIYDNKFQVSYTDGKTYNYINDTPVYTKFKTEDNKLHMSTDLGNTWETISDYIAAQFRWTQEGTSNNIGKIQISRDEGKTWSNLTNSFSNNLHISRYIGANESLPTTGVAEGTIYMKGPYYDENDANNDYPIYRMWVYAWKDNTLAWQDNGEFQSIIAGVVQERGDSELNVMSQAAITRELTELESKAESQLGITRLTDITNAGDKERFNFLPTNKIRVQVATDVTTTFFLYICKKGEDDFNAYNNYQVFQPNKAYSIEFDYDIVGVDVYFTNTTGTGNAEISLNLGLAISVNENVQGIQELRDSINENVQELRDLACKQDLKIGSFSESFVLSTATTTNHEIYFGGYIKDFVINTHSDIVETYVMYARYKGSEDFVVINNYYQYDVGKEYHITLSDDFDAIAIYVGKQSIESTFDATLYANMAKDINLLETELSNVRKLAEDNKSQIVSVVTNIENAETEVGIIKKEFQLVKGDDLRPSDSLIRVNLKRGERFRIRFRTTSGAITQVAGLYDANTDDVYQYSLKTNVFYEFLAKKDEQDLSLLVHGNDISSNTPLLVEIYKGVVNDSISIEDKLGITPTYQYNLTANTISTLGQVVIPIGAKKGEPFEIIFKGDSITNIAGIYAYNGNEDIGTLMYSAKTNQAYQFNLDYDLPYITLLINADSILNDTTLSVEVKRGWYLDTIDRLNELEWKENQFVNLTIKGYANESILEAKNTYNVALKGGTWLRFVITNTDAIIDSLRVNVYYVDGSNELLFFPYNNRDNIILKEDVNKIGFLSYTTQEKDREISIEVDMLYNPENGEYNQPIPSYYFENNYLPNKVARIKELISESAGNGDIFIFSSDEHWDRNAQNSAIIQRYLFNELNINKLIDGGDTRQHLASEELVRLRRFFFGGRKFYVTGNHEYLDIYSEQGKYPAGYLDNSIAYQFNMFNEMANGNLMRNYYYVDFPLQKLRYIVLNAYQQGDEIDKGNGQYSIQAINGYEDEQLTWLNDVALDLEEGWNCLIFTHSLFHYEDRNGMYILEKGKELGKIILNNPSSDKIIAIIQGHTHRDAVVNITDSIVSNTENTGREIPVIVTTSDACYFDDLPGEALTNRKANTIYEQAFDVCILDRTNRKITAVRIGGLASENFNPVGTLEERVINY